MYQVINWQGSNELRKWSNLILMMEGLYIDVGNHRTNILFEKIHLILNLG